MKNKFIYLCIIFFTVCLFACKKPISENKYTQKNIQQLSFTKKNSSNEAYKLSDAPESIPYYLIDGRLKFNSEDDFNNFMNYIEEDEIESWERNIGFQSYFTYVPEVEGDIKGNILLAILNNKGMVQVNKYIFKLIPSSRKVLVMSDDNLSYLYELEEATAGNSKIQEFSFDDEVFGILEEQGGVNVNNPVSAEKSICRDRYASPNVLNPKATYFENASYWRPGDASIHDIEFTGVVQYYKFGISVQLLCNFGNYNRTLALTRRSTSENPELSTKKTIYHAVFSYTPRCRATVSNDVFVEFTNKKHGFYYAYRSTRDCAHYNLTCTFSFQSTYTLLWHRDMHKLTISN
ncbi:MAG: hypothetical protein WCP57_06550 [Bacteroidota bacterium]